QLRVSRLAMDVVASQADFSKEPRFAEAVARKVYYGPVYFRRESEPYMTLALTGTRRDAGVSVAEVNLKLIWDVVSQIKVGNRGQLTSVKTCDELEALADQVNDMAGRLQESYTDLEQKVELRTHELAQSVAELRALGEVSQSVNSTLDLTEMLNTIVTKAVQ